MAKKLSKCEKAARDSIINGLVREHLPKPPKRGYRTRARVPHVRVGAAPGCQAMTDFRSALGVALLAGQKGDKTLSNRKYHDAQKHAALVLLGKPEQLRKSLEWLAFASEIAIALGGADKIARSEFLENVVKIEVSADRYISWMVQSLAEQGVDVTPFTNRIEQHHPHTHREFLLGQVANPFVNVCDGSVPQTIDAQRADQRQKRFDRGETQSQRGSNNTLEDLQAGAAAGDRNARNILRKRVYAARARGETPPEIPLSPTERGKQHQQDLDHQFTREDTHK